MLDRTTVFERGRTNVLSAQLFGIAHAELTSANKIVFGIQRIVRFLAAQGARLACRVHVPVRKDMRCLGEVQIVWSILGFAMLVRSTFDTCRLRDRT